MTTPTETETAAGNDAAVAALVRANLDLLDWCWRVLPATATRRLEYHRVVGELQALAAAPAGGGGDGDGPLSPPESPQAAPRRRKGGAA